MKKSELKDALFIIDGSSFLYRAYYAIRPLHTPDGRAVHAVYGFCRMIKKMIDHFEPTKMVVVFDSPGKTARHEIYEEYKEKRESPPSDLIDQKNLILDFIEAIKLPVLLEPGIEADDLMYSLALQAQKKGITSVIVSSDKDMRQLVNSDIIIFDPFREEFLDGKKLEEKYGFPVERLPFYFALVGDPSDNIPGVRGIGAKRATELVKKFDSLDDLYTHIDSIAESLQKKLIEDRDSAYMSHELFLLRRYPIKMKMSNLVFDRSRWSGARELFESLNFKTLLKDLPEPKEALVPLSERRNLRFITVIEEKQLDNLCQKLKQKKRFALDTEGSGLRPLEGRLAGISVCFEQGAAYYIPFGHEQGKQLPREYVLQMLKPILEDVKIEKILHNAKFDWLVLYSAGIVMEGVVFDTMVAASLLVLNGERYGLKSLSEKYLDDRMLSYKMIMKQGNYATFAQVPLDLATEYSASDAHQTFLLADILKKELKEKEPLLSLYQNIEHPLIMVLSLMEAAGIYLNVEILKNVDKRVARELKDLREAIIDMVGPEYKNINLNSPKQLEELLFEHLKLTPVKKTAGRTRYSTDQEVLMELARHHPIPGLIVKYRELFKLKSTYIDALPNYINSTTGRIHSTFNQTAVATGRLSSSDPNLQNIPVSSALHGETIRAAFESAAGYQFISADYSQIELRVLAFLSQDKTLMDAFVRDSDIHAETAALLFEIPINEVSHDQRQIGKRINFSILYGLTPYGLSRDLNISYADAQEYILKYFEQYPGVAIWMNKIVQFAKENGFVQTYWGRRRYVPGIYEPNRNVYEAARRIAINTVAQGTAAEIMKQGMIHLDKAFAQQGIDGKILIQIHDELVVSVKDDQINESLPIITRALGEFADWNVKLKISLRMGANWQDITK